MSVIKMIKMKSSDFLQKLKGLKKEDILAIKGVGEIGINNLHKFLNSDRFQALYQKLIALETKGQGLEILQTKKPDKQNLVLDKEIVCITGTFEISRDKLKARLENLGAQVASTITSKTTILLAGQKAGSKLAKAKNLGIKIVTNLQELKIGYND